MTRQGKKGPRASSAWDVRGQSLRDMRCSSAGAAWRGGDDAGMVFRGVGGGRPFPSFSGQRRTERGRGREHRERKREKGEEEQCEEEKGTHMRRSCRTRGRVRSTGSNSHVSSHRRPKLQVAVCWKELFWSARVGGLFQQGDQERKAQRVRREKKKRKRSGKREKRVTIHQPEGARSRRRVRNRPSSLRGHPPK